MEYDRRILGLMGWTAENAREVPEMAGACSRLQVGASFGVQSLVLWVAINRFTVLVELGSGELFIQSLRPTTESSVGRLHSIESWISSFLHSVRASWCKDVY